MDLTVFSSSPKLIASSMPGMEEERSAKMEA
eukprot:CAMPEP_0202841544 /NCGR_PEP_ID=MMETSP1389-20130828/58837_1 /ASSEMBLY_ACC=CAM_ASM_000865 /TAXON_ID=302021 /ORGANISM="Rhodomonas sp., Strain CCMP768" /LENGTH=30 /DNA_ID= /DNA_START= /DNA_END= /DNA_ORIENTATION=